MGKVHLLLGAVLCLFLVSQVSATCLCAEKGEDFCSCQQPIRPVPKILERLATAKFPPIGDTCWCGKQLVEPAVQPKPPCKTHPGKKCDCCSHGAPPPPPPCFDALIPPHKEQIGVPADPISVSLALRAGKAFAVPEAKLSYGPVNAPLNALKKIYFSRIPEEKLYALNSQVIELKRRMPKKEEIIEEEEEEEQEPAHPAPYLTYHELGYTPEKFKNPMFMRYSSYAAPTVVAAKKKIDWNCGFKPGKISHNAKLEDDSFIYGEPCL